jgi:uncharacterized protein
VIELDQDRHLRDDAGRLHVADVPVSRAGVIPFFGRSLPNWKNHGLDPDRRYEFFRPPAEVGRKGTLRSLIGVPLCLGHPNVHGDVDDWYGDVVGHVLDPVVFDGVFIRARLVIWEPKTIRRLLAGEALPLSGGYAYELDMEPGSIAGEAYDGTMTDLAFTHVGIVPPDGEARCEGTIIDLRLPEKVDAAA